MVLPLQFWHEHSADPLINQLKEVFGESTKLGDSKLLTNLPVGNFFAVSKDLPLWQVVRASTAAPTYFPPQKITASDGAGQAIQYEFIDGGVSTSAQHPL